MPRFRSSASSYNSGLNENSHTRYFIILAAFFITGAVIGVNAGSSIGGRTGNDTISLIEGFLTYGETAELIYGNFYSIFLNLMKFPAIAILLASSVLGFFITPFLLGVRGFYLGFASAALISLLGDKAKILVFAAYGLSAVITIPALFALSVYTMQFSRNMLSAAVKGRKESGYNLKKCFIVASLCLLSVSVAALLDTYLTPHLVKLAYVSLKA